MPPLPPLRSSGAAHGLTFHSRYYSFTEYLHVLNEAHWLRLHRIYWCNVSTRYLLRVQFLVGRRPQVFVPDIVRYYASTDYLHVPKLIDSGCAPCGSGCSVLSRISTSVLTTCFVYLYLIAASSSIAAALLQRHRTIATGCAPTFRAVVHVLPKK